MLAGFPSYSGLKGRNDESSLKTTTVIGDDDSRLIAGNNIEKPARNSSRLRPTRRICDSLAFPTRRKFLERTLNHLSAAKPAGTPAKADITAKQRNNLHS